MSTPKEPAVNHYLLDAIHRWLVDCGCNVFILVDARQISDPFLVKYANANGIIKLNISPQAIDFLHISAEDLQFRARFKGVERLVVVPIPAIIVITDGNHKDNPTRTVDLPPMAPINIVQQARPVLTEVKPTVTVSSEEKGTVVQLDTFRKTPKS